MRLGNIHPHETWCDSEEHSAGTLLEPFGKITVLKDEDEEEGGVAERLNPNSAVELDSCMPINRRTWRRGAEANHFNAVEGA